MKKTIVRMLAAATLLAGAAAAQAAAVTLTNWAYGSGGKVLATTPTGSYDGQAGGFAGTLSGAGMLDSMAFITYCIELEEHFYFGTDPMVGYRVVEGARYFQVRRGDPGISERLGRLLTYAADNPTLVDDAAGSTALQLAIWNLVYDGDYSVSNAGLFRDASAYESQASALLAGAQGLSASRYDVFALERSGSQDFLLASVQPRATAVPEPGSLGLAAAALAGLALARRRRRRDGVASLSRLPAA